MSRLFNSLRFALLGALLCLAATSRVQAQGYDDAYGDDRGSYQQFYDDLSPYGEWINDPQYGYVWVPDAGDDFRPYYSNGYWVNSEYGNTWVSNYSWGWAPFHYGRWTYSNYYGWLWVPGNQWGPAWVSWRSGGGSYGWAPMGPGISISVALGNSYYAPDYWWTFTPQQYILSPSFHSYCYGPRYNQQYIHQTTIINNTYVSNRNTYIAGPRRQELERAIGRPVQQVAINNISRPDRTRLQGNSLSIYRPAIAENRPRPTERPRNFSPARQPVSEVPNTPRQSGFDRGAMQQAQPAYGRDRGGVIQQAPAQQQQQPVRNVWGNRPPEPRQERPRLDPVMQIPQQQQQPNRGFDRPQPQVTQPVQQQPSRGGWNSNPNPSVQPVQQPQRVDRPVFNRNFEQQRPQVQQQPVQQRPQPAFQQRMEPPRTVSPQPVQTAPRVERVQSGGGNPQFNRR